MCCVVVMVCAGREEVELEKVEEDMRKKRAAKYEQRRKQVYTVCGHCRIQAEGATVELRGVGGWCVMLAQASGLFRVHILGKLSDSSE